MPLQPQMKFQVAFPRDLEERLFLLSAGAQRNAFLPAMRFGMRPFRDEAKKILKRRPWSEGRSPQPPSFKKRRRLWKSIRINTQRFGAGTGKSKSGAGGVFGIVGYEFSRSEFAHSNLVEFGTKQHPIVAGEFRGRKTGRRVLVKPPPKSRPRKIKKGGNNILGPVVIHSGAKAVAPMTQAWRDRKRAAFNRIFFKLDERIDKEIAKIARRKARGEVRRRFGRGARLTSPTLRAA